MEKMVDIEEINKELIDKIYSKVIESKEIFQLIEHHSKKEDHWISMLNFYIQDFANRYNLSIKIKNTGKQLDILLKEFLIPNIIKNYNFSHKTPDSVYYAIENEWNVILLIILKYILEDYREEYPLWQKHKEDLAKVLTDTNRKTIVNSLAEEDYISLDYYKTETDFFQLSIEKINDKINSFFEAYNMLLI